MKIARDPAEAGSMVDFVPFFKAFCHPIRAQIIEFLLGGERCVCEMTGPLDQSQPLVSHHLALLRDAGLITMRNEGTRSYYSIAWERFDSDLGGFLEYVERLRSAPPNLDRTESACAVVTRRVKTREAS
jgi:ArsR family transcriptional regulator, arsenate/arsenite/antimonite-responsive transcriptional repressor